MKQTKKIKIRYAEAAYIRLAANQLIDLYRKKVFETLDRAFGIKHQ